MLERKEVCSITCEGTGCLGSLDEEGSVQEEDVGAASQGAAIDGPQIPQFHQGRVRGTSGN